MLIVLSGLYGKISFATNARITCDYCYQGEFTLLIRAFVAFTTQLKLPTAVQVHEGGATMLIIESQPGPKHLPYSTGDVRLPNGGWYALRERLKCPYDIDCSFTIHT